MANSQQAIFAAGCFWGIEKAFLDVPGVLDATSGYTGGHVEHPTYEQVCSGLTGHAEAVEVVFDPSVVSYEALVRKFFLIHDPTQLNRQGPDVGSQYRSAIFYVSEEQHEIALQIMKELESNYYPKLIATEIAPALVFWKAEDYHQRYFEKHPGAVCHL